jgi:hypothetical protein
MENAVMVRSGLGLVVQPEAPPRARAARYCGCGCGAGLRLMLRLTEAGRIGGPAGCAG